MTGFVYDEAYLKHDTGKLHPERPERLKSIINALEKDGIFSKLAHIKPYPASVESISAVHTREYIQKVNESCIAGKKFMHSFDTVICRDSYEIARLSAGGVLAGVDAVINEQVKNVFCAVRPPGHHSSPDKAMGFCLFNNVAIGARYVQNKYKIKKVLIVDWDVHHGNGTQEIFYNDPSVFYFSVHEYPFYPGSGAEDEIGINNGSGFTLNVPLSKGYGDMEYKKVFEEKLKPAVKNFKPDIIFISAGFDACKGDMLGEMNITENGFADLTVVIKDIAKDFCNGRLISVLEGGYNLVGLSNSVKSHISVLMG